VSKRRTQLPSQACTSELAVRFVRVSGETEEEDSRTRELGGAVLVHCGYVWAVAVHAPPRLLARVSSRVRPPVELRRAQRRVQVVDRVDCRKGNRSAKLLAAAHAMQRPAKWSSAAQPRYRLAGSCRGRRTGWGRGRRAAAASTRRAIASSLSVSGAFCSALPVEVFGGGRAVCLCVNLQGIMDGNVPQAADAYMCVRESSTATCHQHGVNRDSGIDGV
jgi:hypothetical protein